MKLLFMGTPPFAVASAEALRHTAHEIIAVVTAPDKPAGRGLQPRQSAIKEWALSNHLPVHQPVSLKSAEFLDAAKSLHADVFVVVAFRILPKELYAIPPHGSFNLHASLLPKYRGAAPINRAVINGERETGVTTFFLQDSVDTGQIILQEKLSIGESETAGELQDRLAILGASVVVKTVDRIASGIGATTAQNDRDATPAPKLTTENCRIVWTRGAAEIHNHVRGLSPRPGAWTTLNGRTFKILRTHLTDRIPEPACPGECVVDRGTLMVKTEDVMIELCEVQPAGKAPMSGAQVVQGRGVKSGDVFV